MPLKMHQDTLPEMNLTPMIDVVFQLLIFFMVGTRFADMERAVDLHVPKVAPSKNLSAQSSHRVVQVMPDGSLSFDKEKVDLDQLKLRLHDAMQAGQSLAVTVRGDAKTELQYVAEVMAVCRDVGVSELYIPVEMTKRR